LNSPELYPYFMKLRPDGLFGMCNKMSSYLTRVFHKNTITPADTQHLKQIHHSMNIKEETYDKFTKLFAHICCRGKSDSRRKKMLRMFKLLKAHICPSAGTKKNLDAFVWVISNLHSDSEEWTDNKAQNCSKVDAFSNPC